jgi:hypothetical protein
MRHARFLVLLCLLGCGGTAELRDEVDALKERDKDFALRLDDLGRDIRKAENRLAANATGTAGDQTKRIEQAALSVSRMGKEIADLRQEFGRVLDDTARTVQALAKEQEGRKAAQGGNEERAALEKEVRALKDELARTAAALTRRLDELAEQLKKLPAASAPPAPPVKEGATL